MTVLHVITGLDNGGAESALARLVTAPTGVHHHIVSLMTPGLYGPELLARGCPVDSLGMTRGRISLRGLLKLYRLIRGVRPDVVQTWLYHADLIGGVIARLARVRAVVWSVRASDAHVHGGASRMVLRVCAALSRHVPRRIIFNSLAGRMAHEAAGYRAGAGVVVHNGFDVDRLRPDAAVRRAQREAWQVADDTVLVGMVARWDPMKDHQTLASALEQVRAARPAGWTGVLVGPGMDPENADLRALLHAAGVVDLVRLGGPTRDVVRVMNAIDVHVLSSLSEGFPNVLAEAMACGTPVVTTDVGDAVQIVGDTGWVVPPRDAAALAAALVEAIDAARDREAWGGRQREARNRVMEAFSIEQMSVGYNEVWRDAAK